MTLSLNRRKFLASTAAAGGALILSRKRTFAQSSNELRVMVGGGDWGKANIEAYTKPFEAETGIKVTAVTDQTNISQVEMMVTTNNITVDVVDLSQGAVVPLAKKGMFEEIDYSQFRKEDLDGIPDFARKPYGVAALIFAWTMVYNTKTFPADKPRPQTWADFWNVEKFPGKRLLETGQFGAEGPWEEALLADGVAPDKLYPMDIDRIFKSLDKIKPHIRKWWSTGSEIQQLMHDGVGDVMESFDGRAGTLVQQGLPVEINRTQSKLSWDYWVIPKGSPNAANAQKFIAFALRAENQAKFAQLIPYGPANLNAFKLMSEEQGRKLASYPEYLKTSIALNAEWYGADSGDGTPNVERLIQRWNEWILE